MPKEVPISEISDLIKRETIEQLWHFTVGFLRLETTPKGKDVTLLGSGILVKADNVAAILTAHHVTEVLPRQGRLGFILSTSEEKTTIDVTGINPIRIDRGEVDADGPDLAIVCLSTSVATSLNANKSFYNLDLRRDLLLNHPPDDHAGIWVAQGFVEELTSTDSRSNPRKTVKAFCQFGALGGVDSYEVRGGHDYCKFPMFEKDIGEKPKNFGGVSGGGLWQVVLRATEEGAISIDQLLLRGLVYYQDPFKEGASALRCHAHRSLYESAYAAITECAP